MIKASYHYALCDENGIRIVPHLYDDYAEALEVARAAQRQARRLGWASRPITVTLVQSTPVRRVYTHNYTYAPVASYAP